MRILAFLLTLMWASVASAGCVDIVWDDPDCDVVNDEECFEIDEDPTSRVTLVPVRARSAHFDDLEKLNDNLDYLRIVVAQFKEGSVRFTGVSGDAPAWISLHRTGRGLIVKDVGQITTNKTFARLYLNDGEVAGPKEEQRTGVSHAEHMRAAQAAPSVFDSGQSFDRHNAATQLWISLRNDPLEILRTACTPTANDP